MRLAGTDPRAMSDPTDAQASISQDRLTARSSPNLNRMDAPGDIVQGRFELIERLGSGGMGMVWRARDTTLHRDVALKSVRPDIDASDTMRERVLREARALARLSHPNVVTVHHIVEAAPHPWIVMELVPGTSLQERLASGPLSPRDAAGIGRQVLSGLTVAHAAGIQHRDVKPANILLRPDGTAVLTDFGIASLQGTTSLTATGELIGSPEYIAPERIRGHDADPASDLWSLGLVLYVCVEGVSPMRRASTLATLAAVLDDPVPPPAHSGPLAPVLGALLVRDPSARPDAAQLDAMLAQVERGTSPYWAQPTVTAVTPGTRTPTASSDLPETAGSGIPRRRRTTIIAAAAALVTAGAALALGLTLRTTDNGAKAVGAGDGTKTSTSSAPTVSSALSSPAAERTATPTRSPQEKVSPAPAPSRSPSDPPTDGRWIAQLFSEPVASGSAARDQRLRRIRASVPEATFVRSDEYASLRPGFWVIYAPGPFPNGRAALAFCAEHGRDTANTCIGRYLSTSRTDFPLQCRPPAANPSGRCSRDT